MLLPPGADERLTAHFHTQLLVERTGWLRHHHDVRGYQTQITVLKDRGNPAPRVVQIDITLDSAVEGGGA